MQILPQDGGLEQVSNHFKNLVKTKQFLGSEFLLWFWHRSDRNSKLEIPPFEKRDKTPLKIDFWIDDRMVLESIHEGKSLNRYQGGVPATSPETALALRLGKTIREVKIGFYVEGVGEFLATLSAKDLQPRSLLLPELDEKPEDLPLLQVRIDLLRLFFHSIDQVFLCFLEERTSQAWEENHLPALREWIHSQPIKF